MSRAAKRPPDLTTGRHRDPRSHAAILTAAAELLGEVGYRRLAMETVAARAGVSKATIYRWWPSKVALTLDVMATLMPLSPVPDTGDIRADLRSAIRTAIATLTMPPIGPIIPAVAADLLADDPVADRFRAFLHPRRESVLRILRAGAERGELPAHVDAALLFDIYAGTILYRFLISGEPITEALVDQLADLLLDGHTPVDRTRD